MPFGADGLDAAEARLHELMTLAADAAGLSGDDRTISALRYVMAGPMDGGGALRQNELEHLQGRAEEFASALDGHPVMNRMVRGLAAHASKLGSVERRGGGLWNRDRPDLDRAVRSLECLRHIAGEQHCEEILEALTAVAVHVHHWRAAPLDKAPAAVTELGKTLDWEPCRRELGWDTAPQDVAARTDAWFKREPRGRSRPKTSLGRELVRSLGEAAEVFLRHGLAVPREGDKVENRQLQAFRFTVGIDDGGTRAWWRIASRGFYREDWGSFAKKIVRVACKKYRPAGYVTESARRTTETNSHRAEEKRRRIVPIDDGDEASQKCSQEHVYARSEALQRLRAEVDSADADRVRLVTGHTPLGGVQLSAKLTPKACERQLERARSLITYLKTGNLGGTKRAAHDFAVLGISQCARAFPVRALALWGSRRDEPVTQLERWANEPDSIKPSTVKLMSVVFGCPAKETADHAKSLGDAVSVWRVGEKQKQQREDGQ